MQIAALIFQTKTGFPNALQEKWENDPGHQGNHLHNRIRDFYLLPKFLSDKEKREYLKSYKMVTFGRHPFVRLVSTYKDKLIDGLDHSYRKMMNYDDTHPFSVKYFFTSQLFVPIGTFIVPIYLICRNLLKSVHFKKTVALISILSKLCYFLF